MKELKNCSQTKNGFVLPKKKVYRVKIKVNKIKRGKPPKEGE